MKKLILILFLLPTFGAFSQIESKNLTEQEINTIFTKENRKKHNINFEIIKCYKYNDNSGSYYIILTQQKKENTNSENEDEQCYNFIKGYVFKNENNKLIRQIVFTDALQDEFENTIYHWTKYFKINDYDKDGIVDPIFVYGAEGDNDIRFRILIYYKGEKTALRMTDGTLDDSRSIQIDKSFYKLPNFLQQQTLKIMGKMEDDDSVTFPYQWKEKIKNKKTSFENGSNE